MARPRVAAGALFFDENGQVMLVKPTYKRGWEIPGGYVEPGETPIEACQREVLEELGLERRMERLLVVDWAPSEAEGDKILFVFDGGLLAPQDAQRIVVPADELRTCAFHPPEGLPEVLIDRLARRVTAAVEARKQGTVRYLEHGTIRFTG
jgi:8-oxo-dGTP diphosphatase